MYYLFYRKHDIVVDNSKIPFTCILYRFNFVHFEIMWILTLNPVHVERIFIRFSGYIVSIITVSSLITQKTWHISQWGTQALQMYIKSLLNHNYLINVEQPTTLMREVTDKTDSCQIVRKVAIARRWLTDWLKFCQI